MKDLEQQIKNIPLDEPSVELDERIHHLLANQQGPSEPDAPVIAPHFRLPLMIGAAAAILIIGLFIGAIWQNGQMTTTPPGSVTTWASVEIGGSQLVVRKRFMVSDRAVLVCWSSQTQQGEADSGTGINAPDTGSQNTRSPNSAPLPEYTTSHTGQVKYKLIPLRTDHVDGKAWHWTLFIAENADLDIRTDPPFIKDAESGLALMLSAVDLARPVDAGELLEAQRQTLSPGSTEAQVYQLEQLRSLVNRGAL